MTDVAMFGVVFGGPLAVFAAAVWLHRRADAIADRIILFVAGALRPVDEALTRLAFRLATWLRGRSPRFEAWLSRHADHTPQP